MRVPAAMRTFFSTQLAPMLTRSPRVTPPSNTQLTSMATSRPQARCPRTSMRAGYGDSGGRGEGDDAGEVVLALGVVVRQPREPGFQLRRGHDHDAGVHLPDRLLGVGRVLLLDDARNRAGFAHHAAVAMWIAMGGLQFVDDADAPRGKLARGIDNMGEQRLAGQRM